MSLQQRQLILALLDLSRILGGIHLRQLIDSVLQRLSVSQITNMRTVLPHKLDQRRDVMRISQHPQSLLVGDMRQLRLKNAQSVFSQRSFLQIGIGRTRRTTHYSTQHLRISGPQRRMVVGLILSVHRVDNRLSCHMFRGRRDQSHSTNLRSHSLDLIDHFIKQMAIAVSHQFVTHDTDLSAGNALSEHTVIHSARHLHLAKLISLMVLTVQIRDRLHRLQCFHVIPAEVVAHIMQRLIEHLHGWMS
mmetsp:Transcript_39843/g.63759  ORF Transcript_39843/g.63759 Transcript_39843/m.63759 type:complete len:247 (-) Transcript_39843:127-867(-)